MDFTMDMVEIKKFIIARFSNTNDFDNLCRRLKIQDIFEGNWDVRATELLKKFESENESDDLIPKLYKALLLCKPGLKKTINKLFQKNLPDKYIKKIKQNIDKIFRKSDMKEYCRALLDQLNNETLDYIDEGDIPDILIEKGTLRSIVLFLIALERYNNNNVTTKNMIDSIWANLRIALGYLVKVIKDWSWIINNKDLFENLSNSNPINLPVSTPIGVEVFRAIAMDDYADLCKGEKGYQGKSLIVYEFPKNKTQVIDIVKEIKIAIYNAIVKEPKLKKYNKEAEERIIARLQMKNEINERQFLVIKGELSNNSEVLKMLKENTLPLSIIRLTPDFSKNIFHYSEIELEYYIKDFFSKKPK